MFEISSIFVIAMKEMRQGRTDGLIAPSAILRSLGSQPGAGARDPHRGEDTDAGSDSFFKRKSAPHNDVHNLFSQNKSLTVITAGQF
jgi:hypothetical protein